MSSKEIRLSKDEEALFGAATTVCPHVLKQITKSEFYSISVLTGRFPGGKTYDGATSKIEAAVKLLEYFPDPYSRASAITALASNHNVLDILKRNNHFCEALGTLESVDDRLAFLKHLMLHESEQLKTTSLTERVNREKKTESATQQNL